MSVAYKNTEPQKLIPEDQKINQMQKEIDSIKQETQIIKEEALNALDLSASLYEIIVSEKEKGSV